MAYSERPSPQRRPPGADNNRYTRVANLFQKSIYLELWQDKSASILYPFTIRSVNNNRKELDWLDMPQREPPK